MFAYDDIHAHKTAIDIIKYGARSGSPQLILPTSIVLSVVTDKLQECGKKQWITEELLQSKSRFNEEMAGKQVLSGED